MIPFETFATTADVGIRIQGNDFSQLYRNALMGINFLYFDDQEIPAAENPRIQPFRFSGDGPENVLVNFLSEIVYLLQTEDLVTVRVNFLQAAEKEIDAQLFTIPCCLKPAMEIKSVTYHNLRVEEKNGVKSAEIVFDV